MLENKTRMDEEAESTLSRIHNRIEAVLHLFQRNRQSGTTTALKEAVKKCDSPLLLSGEERHGNQVLSQARVKHDRIGEAVSWNSISPRDMAGKNDRELIVDNFFILRAFDSILSAFDFMWAEIRRLQKQNDDLRNANERLSKHIEEAHQEAQELKKKQKEIKENMRSLKEKIDSHHNGREK